MISLDEYLVKNLPVEPNIFIRPEPGYIQVGKINIIPHTIDVAGPRVETILAARFLLIGDSESCWAF